MLTARFHRLRNLQHILIPRLQQPRRNPPRPPRRTRRHNPTLNTRQDLQDYLFPHITDRLSADVHGQESVGGLDECVIAWNSVCVGCRPGAGDCGEGTGGGPYEGGGEFGEFFFPFH